MAAQYYLLALSIYGASALGCLMVWYRMTRGISIRSLKILLRGSGLIVLFTLWNVAGDSGPLAPAFLTMLFDGLTLGTEEMLRTGRILGGLWGLLLILILVELIVNRFRVKPESKEPVEPTV